VGQPPATMDGSAARSIEERILGRRQWTRQEFSFLFSVLIIAILPSAYAQLSFQRWCVAG